MNNRRLNRSLRNWLGALQFERQCADEHAIEVKKYLKRHGRMPVLIDGVAYVPWTTRSGRPYLRVVAMPDVKKARAR